MAKILLLSTNYLSKTSTNGQIARTFFDEVSRRGNSVIVLTTDRSPLITNNSDVDVRVIHTPSWFKWVIYLCKFISRDFAQWLDIDGFYYRKSAKKLGLKLIREEGVDVIHSICIGYSAHLLAQELYNRTKAIWVAQFYDPWSDNFYRIFKTNFFRRLDSQNERKLAMSANVIIHSNTVIKDVWQRRYGEDVSKKITIIPFNLGSVQEKKRNERTLDEPVVFSHIGNFYNQRNSLTFIEAIKRVLDLRPELRAKLKVVFVGRVTEPERDRITEYKLEDIFNLVGLVSEEECNQYYQNSDVFISIDAPTDKPNVFYPSKIIKYFYFEKPILGITPPDSPSDRAFKEAGYASFANDDVTDIMDFVVRAVQNYNSICHFNHDYWKGFTNQHLVDLYSNCINHN